MRRAGLSSRKSDYPRWAVLLVHDARAEVRAQQRVARHPPQMGVSHSFGLLPGRRLRRQLTQHLSRFCDKLFGGAWMIDRLCQSGDQFDTRSLRVSQQPLLTQFRNGHGHSLSVVALLRPVERTRSIAVITFRIRTGRNRGGGDYRPSPARPVLRRCNALLTALVLHDIGVRQNFIRHRQVRARRSDRGATPSSAAGGRLSIHRTGRRRNHSNSKRKDCAETRRRLDV